MKKIITLLILSALSLSAQAAPKKSAKKQAAQLPKKAVQTTDVAASSVVASPFVVSTSSDLSSTSSVSLVQPLGQSTASIESVKPKSKFSVGTAFLYEASNLSDFTGKVGPSGAANLAGNLGIGYAFSSINKAGIGINYKIETPFHQVDKKFSDQAIVSEPYLNYQNTLDLGNNLMMINILRLYQYTSDKALAVKKQNRIRWISNAEKVIENSRLTVAFFSDLNYLTYSDEAKPLDSVQNKDEKNPGRTDFALEISPYANYKLSDSLALYVDISFLKYSHLRMDTWNFDSKENITLKDQSLGLEISAIKNVSITPKVSIVAEDFRPETSYFSLYTTISFL